MPAGTGATAVAYEGGNVLLEWPRDDNGKLAAYAWPGGYPILYLMSGGEVLCPRCANRENECSDAWVREDGVEPYAGEAWRIMAWFIHWEGEPEVCANCFKEVESAYGVGDGARLGTSWDGE